MPTLAVPLNLARRVLIRMAYLSQVEAVKCITLNLQSPAGIVVQLEMKEMLPDRPELVTMAF